MIKSEFIRDCEVVLEQAVDLGIEEYTELYDLLQWYYELKLGINPRLIISVLSDEEVRVYLEDLRDLEVQMKLQVQVLRGRIRRKERIMKMPGVSLWDIVEGGNGRNEEAVPDEGTG